MVIIKKGGILFVVAGGPDGMPNEKNREDRNGNIFDIDWITRVALHKTKIRARLEGREIS